MEREFPVYHFVYTVFPLKLEFEEKPRIPMFTFQIGLDTIINANNDW